MRNKDLVVPKYYNDTFTSITGEQVLLELTSLYYDRISYTKGDQFETAFKEGQRSVIEFILRKVADSDKTESYNNNEEK